MHKIYFDLDMSKDQYEKIGTYEEVKTNILNTFKNQLSEYSSLSIAESCKKDYKISYRIVLNDYKLKIKEMKDWVKDIKENFQEPFKSCIDTMPYMSNGMIRLPFCSKDGEDRPLNIIQGKFKDFITCYCKDAIEIDITEIKSKDIKKEIDKIKKIVNKEKINNNKVSDDIMTELLNNLKYSRCDDYKEWVQVGMALYNDGYDIKLYRDFSKRSKKYTLGCEVRKWQQFKDFKDGITTASLWYYLSQDNNEKFIELKDKVDCKNYDFKIDLTESTFDLKKMYQLMVSDVAEMGFTEYTTRFFIKSKSYNYFNHYHFLMSDQNIYFKIQYIGKRKEINNIDMNGYKQLRTPQPKGGDWWFVSSWMENINSKTYSTIDFKPKQKIKDDIFNLFNGFDYEDDNLKYDLELIKPILDHIRYLCNEEKDDKQIMTNYILNWISHIIQKPSRKTESALVFYSRVQGVGKNAFTDIIKSLFNGYTASDQNLERLLGKFNALLKAKLIVIADEVSPTAKELNDSLKNIITRKEINIEYKGKDPIPMLDTMNYIFTTNNELAFKVDCEDRRYCLIECPEIKKDDVYFDNLYNTIDDKNTMKSLFNFFLTRDIKNINIRNIPITDYKKRNQQQNLPIYIKMIKDTPSDYINQDINPVFINTKMQQYCKNRNFCAPRVTDRQISLDLNKYYGRFKIKAHGVMVFRFLDIDELERHIKDTFIDDGFLEEIAPADEEPKENKTIKRLEKKII